MSDLVRYPLSFEELPEGTITILFTDIEGSTRLLDQLKDRYAKLLDEHHHLMRQTFKKWQGREIETAGDSFYVTFPRALNAVGCVIEAQRAIA